MSLRSGHGLRDVQTNPDLCPSAAEVARVVANVRDDQLTDPTPCAGISVAAMLDHLLGLSTAFRMAAAKVPPEGGPSAEAANLAADWRTRLPAHLDALGAAWRVPEAWDGMTEAGGVTMPAAAMGVVALNEVLVHGWDVAVATGQEYRPDPASVRACLEMIGDRTDATNEPEGLFGPVVPVPHDAPLFDRLLGQTGRGLGWIAR